MDNELTELINNIFKLQNQIRTNPTSFIPYLKQRLTL